MMVSGALYAKPKHTIVVEFCMSLLQILLTNIESRLYISEYNLILSAVITDVLIVTIASI